jgi:hypothetical protein
MEPAVSSVVAAVDEEEFSYHLYPAACHFNPADSRDDYVDVCNGCHVSSRKGHIPKFSLMASYDVGKLDGILGEATWSEQILTSSVTVMSYALQFSMQM